MSSIESIPANVQAAVGQRAVKKPELCTKEGFTPSFCKAILAQMNDNWNSIAQNHHRIAALATSYTRQENEFRYAIKVLGLRNTTPGIVISDQKLFEKYVVQTVCLGCIILTPAITFRLMSLDMRGYCEGMLTALGYFDKPSKDHIYHGAVVVSTLADVVRFISLSVSPSRPMRMAIEILNQFDIPEDELCVIVELISDWLKVFKPVTN